MTRRKVRVLSGPGKELLLNGITRQAIATNLPNEGRQDIRELIEEYDFFDEYMQIKNILFIRDKENSASIDLLHSLVAKELMLLGKSVLVTSLSKLLTDEMMDEIYHKVRAKERSIDWVFVTNFYKTHSSKGSIYPISQIEEIESFIRIMYYEFNIGFGMYVGGTLKDMGNWWSEDFTQFLQRTSITLKAKAKAGA